MSLLVGVGDLQRMLRCVIGNECTVTGLWGLWRGPDECSNYGASTFGLKSIAGGIVGIPDPSGLEIAFLRVCRRVGGPQGPHHCP
jgi:hypothetical protein